jgi:hypothetical protein
VIQRENEAKRLAKEQEKVQRASGGYAAQRRQYKKGTVNRGHGEEGEENKYALDEENKRSLDEYVRVLNKNTEFFTTELPDDILQEILGYCEEKGMKAVAAKDKYKVRVEGAAAEGGALVEASVVISKAGEGKYCVEFKKAAGDALDFFKLFNKIKEELDLEDAVY